MYLKTMDGSLKSILVVEDDEFNQEILRRKLGLLGFTDIHVANNGRTGVRVLEKLPRPPDFLICDIFMPDMDGIEFVAELVKRNYKGGLILMTGVDLAMLEVAQEIASLKGLNVLGGFKKPLDQEKLRQAFEFSVKG